MTHELRPVWVTACRITIQKQNGAVKRIYTDKVSSMLCSIAQGVAGLLSIVFSSKCIKNDHFLLGSKDSGNGKHEVGKEVGEFCRVIKGVKKNTQLALISTVY